jgi:hypothetical protein
VLPLVTFESVFQVTWNGADNLSGLRAFNIQYQDSSRVGEWVNWLTEIPSSKTYYLFTGQPGHEYAFRCQSTDQADNMGSYPDTADASTRIDPAAQPPAPWWDNAYNLKRNLTVLNNMPGMNLPLGYPVHLHFDSGTVPTAAELYDASQSTPKCKDLRVVYNDADEINCVITHCGSDSIDIWFRTRVSVPAGSSDNISHQLYYSNVNAGDPPADPNQVWFPFGEADTGYLFFFQEGSGSTAYDYSGYGRNC